MKDKPTDPGSSEMAVANDHLLAVDAHDGYAIRPPWGWDEDFKAHESLARTPDDAWKRFCHPSLNRAAYEADGFEAVPVKMEIRFGIAAWMKMLTDEQVIEKTQSPPQSISPALGPGMTEKHIAHSATGSMKDGANPSCRSKKSLDGSHSTKRHPSRRPPDRKPESGRRERGHHLKNHEQANR